MIHGQVASSGTSGGAEAKGDLRFAGAAMGVKVLDDPKHHNDPLLGRQACQRRSLDDVALLYELGNLVPVHWASWQVEVVRHPAMTGDVLRQAEPLGVSGDELLVFSRCRSDAEADAPVAVLVDDEPREVLLADEEASVRRVPIVRSCFWKGQADVRRSIEQLWFHRHIMTKRRLAARPLPPGPGATSSKTSLRADHTP